MSMHITASQLRAVRSLKWTYYEEDVLAAWVAEMDFGLAPPIARALHEAVDRGDTGYWSLGAERASAEASSDFWTDRIGWSLSPESVFHAPDVVEGVRRAIVHLTARDTPVVLHTPAYSPFFSMVERAGRDLIEVVCRPDSDGRYRLDLDEIDSAFAQGAGSLVLCNPWNPTGRSFERSELEDVIAIAASHRARVISDEIHAPLNYPETKHVPAASVDPEAVVTVTSASKSWNLPGLKCAQVFLSNERDIDIWSSYFDYEKIGVSNLGLIASTAAYDEGREWLDEVKQRLVENRRLLGELVADHLPGVGYVRPQATYLAWLDFAEFDLGSPAKHFLDQARVALTDGKPFRGDSGRHARLNIATTPELLTEIVERMGAALTG